MPVNREQLKPYQPIFCLMVFAILGLGYYQEHVGRVQPVDEFPFPDGGHLELPRLEAPGGELSLSGRVYDAQGEPAPEVQVSLQRATPIEDQAEPLHWTVTDADGRYQLHGLEALNYDVLLYQAGVPISAGTRTLQLPIEGQQDFTLAAPQPPVEAIPNVVRAHLFGSIQLPIGHLPSDHPMQGYDVVAHPLSSLEEMTGATTRHATMNQLGDFTFEDLVLGPYRLELLPPWAAGGTWPVVGSLEWEHTGEDPGGDAALPLQAGAVTGVVLDANGQPLEGAVVLLWPLDQPHRVWPLTLTSSTGRVRIDDLPRGTYVVRVRAGSASSEVQVEVQAGITSGLTFDALDPSLPRADD